LARFGRLDRAENGKQLEGELAILAEVQVTIENGRVSWWVRRIVGAGGGGRGWWPAGGGSNVDGRPACLRTRGGRK
jgi:hypothetical protein